MCIRDSVTHTLAAHRYAWIQVVKGDVSFNGQSMKEGDGAGISGERELTVSGTGSSGGEILLFDLP